MTARKWMVGSVAMFEHVSVQVVTVQTAEIALFLQEDGGFLAVENRCPHKAGPLAEGIRVGEFVFCPLHDWKINLRDGEAQFPDKGCVQTYPVEVVDDFIYITVPHTTAGSVAM